MEVREKTMIFFIRDDEKGLESVLEELISSRNLMHKKFVMFVQENRIIVLPGNLREAEASLVQAVMPELLRRKKLGCFWVAISCFESRHLIFEFPMPQT